MQMKKKPLLTIILPFGKFQYKKMPMGLKISVDVFQREMTKLFSNLDVILIYIDDILVVTKGDFQDHLEKLQIVLERFRKQGMQLNGKKSYFATQEVEYLGYIINRKVRVLIGLVNFYRDVWKRRSHFMAPLTNLVCQKRGE